MHSPCCHVKYYKEYGSWSKQVWGIFDPDLDIHTQHHKEAREQMRQGKRYTLCEVCYRREDVGLRSQRAEYLEQAENENWNIDYNSEPTHVRSMDIKFDSTCNLGCRMCDPSSSSFLNNDLKKIPQEDRFNKEEVIYETPNHSADNKLKMSKRLIASGLTEFKTTGGEPFLQRHFIDLVDWCIENNYNQNLELKFTTNLIKLNEKLMQKLLTFKQVDVTISCDGVGSVYEYIRYPGRWQEFTEAYKILQTYKQKHINFQISTVLQIHNLFDLQNLQTFFGKDTTLGIDWDLNPDGSEISIDHLPVEVLQSALDLQSDFFEKVSSLKIYIQNLIKQNNPDYDKIKQFCRKTVILDKHRKQIYAQSLHPVIVDLINTTNGE